MTTVLVVDDDPMVRMLVQETLATRGLQVFEAGDGLEAIEFLAERGPISSFWMS